MHNSRTESRGKQQREGYAELSQCLEHSSMEKKLQKHRHYQYIKYHIYRRAGAAHIGYDSVGHADIVGYEYSHGNRKSYCSQ